MKNYKKSTFHKLYLIEPELYYKILPLLNDMDKQELSNLNDQHSEKEMSDFVEKQKQEEQLESQLESNPSMSEINSQSSVPDTRVENVAASTIDKAPINDISPATSHSTKRKRPKQFPCQNCTKSFTTKFSLRRHIKSFHSNQPNEEVVTTTKSKKRPLEDTPSVPPKTLKLDRGQKRKISDEDDTTDIKQPRLENTTMGQQDFLAPRGIKRKIKPAIDIEPRKKTRWIDFY